MKITKADVEQVARLARLEITETEKEAFGHQLNGILSYVNAPERWRRESPRASAAAGEFTYARYVDQVRAMLAADAPMKRGAAE